MTNFERITKSAEVLAEYLMARIDVCEVCDKNDEIIGCTASTKCPFCLTDSYETDEKKTKNAWLEWLNGGAND